MDDFNVQRHIESRFSDLRTWIIVHGVYTVLSIIVLARVSSRTRDLIGMILLFYALLSEMVRLMFHRADKVQNRGAQFVQYNQPPCGGMFGNGGARSSFIFFYIYMLAIGVKLFSMWQYCNGRSEPLQADGLTVSIFISAACCFFTSLWIAEVARQMSDPPLDC